MSKNIIIESRQQNATTIINSGEWETVLSTPIEINDGDIVQVSKAFIDTVSEGDSKMVIPYDITLDLNNIIYVNNTIKGLPSNIFTYNNEGAAPTYSQGEDGEDFIWCDRFDVIDPRKFNGYEQVTGINLEAYDPFNSCFLGVEDIGLSGKLETTYIYVPGLSNGYNNFNIPITPISCIPSSLKPNPYDSNWLNNNIRKYLVVISTTSLTDAILSPIVFNNKIDISKGEYSPNDMVNLINNKLQDNNNDETNFTLTNIVNSPYLKTTADCIQAANKYVRVTRLVINIADGGNLHFYHGGGDIYTTGELLTINFENMPIAIKNAIDAALDVNGYQYLEGSTKPVEASPAGYVTLNAFPPGVPLADAYIDLTSVVALAGGAKYELINTGDDYNFFARHDGNRTLSPTLTLGTNYFIGTNQIQLNYDVTNSKFYWEWLHMPIYQAGTAIVSTYGKDPI